MDMKCSKCGTEFNEGIFCPECGTKYSEQKTEESIKKKEAECVAREQAEAERIAREQAETERLVQENIKKEMESRTVRGTVYKSLDEAEVAKREHHMIDILKSQLMETKSQKKRKEIIGRFNEQIETIDAKNRYALLKNKVTKEIPLNEKIHSIYGITVLISLIVNVILLMSIEGEAPLIGKICIIWCGFGVWVWPIWKIVLFIKSKGKDYYKNIKNI